MWLTCFDPDIMADDGSPGIAGQTSVCTFVKSWLEAPLWERVEVQGVVGQDSQQAGDIVHSFSVICDLCREQKWELWTPKYQNWYYDHRV